MQAGARHTACSHPRVTPGAPQCTQAYTHTPVSSTDPGFWPELAGTDCLTQKRMREILISVEAPSGYFSKYKYVQPWFRPRVAGAGKISTP